MDACHCNSFAGGMGGGSQMQGVRKVDIGKEAILRAAAALTARDELGRRRLQRVGALGRPDRSPSARSATSQGAIAGISPNGPTNIFAGLDQAVGSLEKATATRRHIILLTDGWSSSGQYDDIIARMKAAGITLSTVGAGGGANPFLEQLAKQGGGRFYPAANPAAIPDIFLKETEQVSGQQIVEEPFFPIQTARRRSCAASTRASRSCSATTARPRSRPRRRCSSRRATTRSWRSGSTAWAASVAWTSDATGRWATSWVGWEGFSRFFSQLVGWTFPGEETGGIEATFETAAGGRGCTSRAWRPTARRATSTRRSVTLVGPGPRAREAWTWTRWRPASTRPRSASSSRAPTRCG